MTTPEFFLFTTVRSGFATGGTGTITIVRAGALIAVFIARARNLRDPNSCSANGAAPGRDGKRRALALSAVEDLEQCPAAHDKTV